jgi:F0F1-type ATP synthase membrane subunit b/b'
MIFDKDGDLTAKGGVSLVTLIVSFILGIIVLCMWGCPKYNVYQQRKEGEANLAHAQSSKEVAVAEAKAKMESAAYNAQADTIRAHGIARANQIIGNSLKGNQEYLQWLWIDELKTTQNQIIYVPSGGMGLPILESQRLNKPTVPAPVVEEAK